MQSFRIQCHDIKLYLFLTLVNVVDFYCKRNSALSFMDILVFTKKKKTINAFSVQLIYIFFVSIHAVLKLW